jgi:hypothetical protein
VTAPRGSSGSVPVAVPPASSVSRSSSHRMTL